MITTLVTGAAGFIGSHLCKELLARGEEVIAVDCFTDYYSIELKQRRVRWIQSNLDDEYRFRFIQVDFADHASLGATLKTVKLDRIAHLGAQAGVRYSIDNPRAYVQSNLVGHLNLLELARERVIDHFVYASSSSVYGTNKSLPFRVEDRVDFPISLYAATKKADELMSETYSHLYRIPQTGLRFFTVYGPWGRPDMAVWLFTDAILSGTPIKLFNNGNMTRDFTYIDDVIAGVVACLDNPPSDDVSVMRGGSVAPHRIYNIGNNKPEPLDSIVAAIENACGRTANREYCPMQPGDVPATFADISAIQRDLGFKPSTPITVGIPEWMDWYRQYAKV